MLKKKRRGKYMYIEPGSTVCTRGDIDRYKMGWTLEVKKKGKEKKGKRNQKKSRVNRNTREQLRGVTVG
jgi:hypothetical protein